MNIERMLDLANQLENPTDPRLRKVTFDMTDFSGEYERISDAIACGTAACIGGTACILYGDQLINGVEARLVLDLSLDQAGRLFYNNGDYISREHCLSEITPKEAVAAIRRMVDEEAEADWARTQEAELSELVLA